MFTFLTQMIHGQSADVEVSADAVVNPQVTDAVEQTAHTTSGFDMGELIVHHLSDSPLWHFEIGGYDLSITKRVVMMWIAAIFMLSIFIPAARRIAKNTYKRPSRFSGMIEVLVNFIRKDVGEGSMGSHSRNYEPFLLTMFFFILFSNLLGLIPPLGELVHTVAGIFGGGHEVAAGAHDVPTAVKIWPGITPTGDINVTATLAIFSFVAIIGAGFANQGIAFVKNIVPKGIHWAIWPIMWPIELAGLIIKPTALAIRLLANMTAGHLMILVFLGFIFQFQNIWVAFPSVGASVAIYLLEIFVGFLQAYIFVFLTALFIGAAQHRH